MSLDNDPEITAAFAPASDDPEISAAFAPESSSPYSPIHALKGIAGIGEAALSGITAGAGSLADAVTGADPGTHDWAYRPRTEEGKLIQKTTGDVASAAGNVLNEDLVAPAVTGLGGNPEAARQTLAERVPEALGAVGAITGGVGALRGGIARLTASGAPELTAEEIAKQSTAPQSMGAAGAAPNVAAASPELQSAIQTASRKTGGAVNPDVLQRHLEADLQGVQLTKGQATRDPGQFSEEQNSTHPDIVNRLNQQNTQMVDALDTIRRDASSTTVGNDYIENGRAAVDALKQYDEPIQADIRAKYKALTDANGGSVPIDQGQFLTNVDTALKKGFLTKTAAATPEISEILDSVRSGEPMDFEAYENARTRLASAQRAGGSSGEAARIVRGQLEQMPLSPEAAGLKGLADTARSAAKARFDALEADPAYQAAVDDVSAGNAKGSPSPLADTFLDKYALSKSAPKSQVDLMMQKINTADPDAAGAVASHALNAVRKAAIGPNGNVLPAGYNGAIAKLGPKLDSLISPEIKDNLESLGRVVTNAKVAPPGSYVNYSKSGVIMNAAKGAAEHAINTKTLGMYGLAKKVLTGDKFAKEALAPGAGLDQLATKP